MVILYDSAKAFSGGEVLYQLKVALRRVRRKVK